MLSIVAITSPAFAAPDNDNFADRREFYSSNGSGTFTAATTDATAEIGEPEHDGNTPRKSVWYSFTPSRDGVFTFDTIGSDFDTVLAAYVGTDALSTVGGLLPYASDDDSGGGSTSKMTFAGTYNVTYYIAVDGYNGASGNLSSHWSMTDESPVNDTFADAHLLQYSTDYLYDNNRDATREVGEPSHAANIGGKSLWYKWKAIGNGQLTLKTGTTSWSSEFDTLLAVYTGDSVDALTSKASNDNVNATDLTSKVTVNVVAGTTYYIAVDGKNSGSGAANGDLILDWAYTATAPANNNFTSAQLISGPSGTVFGTTAGATKETNETNHSGSTGGKSVWYKWVAPAAGRTTFTLVSGFSGLLGAYKASGATATVSTLTSVNTINDDELAIFNAVAGTTYYLAVDSYYVSDASIFDLKWVTASSNDTFTSAQTISGKSGTIAGSNTGASREPSEDYPFEYYGASVWYKWTAPANGNASFSITGNNFDTTIGIYKANATPATVSNLALVAADNDSGGNGASKIAFRATAATVYYIVVDGYNEQQGNFTLNWYGAPANDDIASAQLISGNSNDVTGTNIGASRETNEPDHAGNSNGKSVWYKWTPAVTGYGAIFDASGSGINAIVGVYSDSSFTPVERKNRDGQDSKFEFNPIAGKTYFIAVEGIDGDEGNVLLDWEFNPAKAPNNDLFANAELMKDYDPDALQGYAGSATGGNLNTMANQPGEPVHAGNIGGASIWYLWRAPVTGTVTFTTDGSLIDTLMGIYQGTAVNALTTIASNDDITATNEISSATFEAIAGNSYYIAVDGKNYGSGPEQGAIQLNWSMSAVAPSITSFTPGSGPIGTKVTIKGVNLLKPSRVRLNGTTAPFSVYADRIIATVPANATSGKITIEVSALEADNTPTTLTVTSTTDFVVTSPRITDLTPDYGFVGSILTIDGYNFNGTTAVNLNGVSVGPLTTNIAAATSGFQIVSDYQIKVKIPVGATSGWVTVFNTGGSYYYDSFSVLPFITEVTPNVGGVGAIIVIKGNSFNSVNSVRFNGTYADYIVNSSTQITAKVPPDATTGPVQIYTSSGSSNTVNFAVNTPGISSFTPSNNVLGAIVTLTGTNFTGATAVKFNGTSAGAAVANITTATSGFQIVSATQIKAKVPAGATTGPISVTNPSGTSTTSSFFTVVPAITNLNPSSGKAGSLVTITGSNFVGITRIDFNGTQANFVVNSASQMTATVPLSATTGPIKITFSASTGTWTTNNTTNIFTVTSPIISSFTPTSGDTGTVVTINGSNLSAITAVSFNGTSAGAKVTNIDTATSGFQIVSAVQIKAKVPANSTVGPISVTNAIGTATSTSNFTPTSPVIADFTPSGGPVGTVVIINGANFTGTTAVKFNNTPAASFTVNSSTKITATVANGTTSGAISLTTPKGTISSGSRLFTISAALPPTVSNFTPTFGVSGTIVTLTGTNFTGTTAVKFNGVNAGAAVANITTATAGYQIVSATQIKVKIPSGATTGQISVTNAGGTASSTNIFTVPPAIISFNPTSGKAGSVVTITGSNFAGITRVDFNGTQANFVVNSATQITATVPATATTGPIKTTASLSAGTFTFTTPSSYSITNPTIASFTPTNGIAGTVVTINGQNFTGTTAVKFNGVVAGNPVADINTATAGFQIVSATQIRAKVPATATSGQISVTNANGTATSSNRFSVLPTITNFTPLRENAGSIVTINGNGFNDVNDVRFNGTSAAYIVNSSTKITVAVPSNATIGKISVYTDSGTATSTASFTAAPRVSQITPFEGATGTLVTLNGNNFSSATSVTFNGVSAGAKVTDITTATTGYQIVSDTRILVKVPAAATSGLIGVSSAGVPVLSGNSAQTFYIAPSITSFTPLYAAPGVEITITGVNFTGATSVTFIGDPSTPSDDRSADFTVVSATQVKAKVPANAISGPIRIANPNGAGTGTTDFKVAPRISSFSPSSGLSGTSVLIKGANFSGTTSVKFNTISTTTFTVNSAGTEITVAVPAGATTGKISVITAAGTGVSSVDFIVG